MSETATKSEQIEVGALWQKEGRTQKFIAGNIDFAKLPDDQWKEFQKTRKLPVVIFNNKFKQKDSHPDLRVYLSKPKEGAVPTTPAPKTTTAAAQPTAPAPVTDPEVM